MGNALSGRAVMAAIGKKLRSTTEGELAKSLGVTGQAVRNWRRRPSLTPLQVATLVSNARKSGAHALVAQAIKPVVEFFEIEGVDSRHGARVELFNVQNDDGSINHYRKALKERLQRCTGLYIFFDSRGRSLYVGKTNRQTLWSEIKSAYNRERNDLQTIKRVPHPRKGRRDGGDSKFRQIRDVQVPLHELAAYFSAYEVHDDLIDTLEAMLVRGFANDILNKRMETFKLRKVKKLPS